MAFQCSRPAFQCSPASLSKRRAGKHPTLIVLGASPIPPESEIARHIDLQSDTTKYGRGEAHLSFDLEPGDVVVYQRGTWYVDGVAVGPGDDPYWSYALVDGLQVVWTHNCEHGVVRGWHLDLDRDGGGGGDESDDNSGGMVHVLRRSEAEEEVEFGPEQIIGRIRGIQWDEISTIAATPVPLNDDIWRKAAEEQF